MKFSLLISLLVLSFTVSAKEVSSSAKLMSVDNIGTRTQPIARAIISLSTKIETQMQESVIVTTAIVTSHGDVQILSSGNSRISVNSEIAGRMNFGTAKKPIEGTIHKIELTYNSSRLQSKQNFSVLVKANGETTILN